MTQRTTCGLALAAFATLLAGGCRRTVPATEIVAIVRSNIPLDTLKTVKLYVVESGDRPELKPLFASACVCVGPDSGCTNLPLYLGIGPSNMITPRSGSFTVYARGFRDLNCNTQLVEQSATVTFTAQLTLALEMNLVNECIDVICQPGTTCYSQHRCVDDHRNDLPPLGDGGAGSSDGGAPGQDLVVLPDFTVPDLFGADLTPPPPDFTPPPLDFAPPPPDFTPPPPDLQSDFTGMIVDLVPPPPDFAQGFDSFVPLPDLSEDLTLPPLSDMTLDAMSGASDFTIPMPDFSLDAMTGASDLSLPIGDGGKVGLPDL